MHEQGREKLLFYNICHTVLPVSSFSFYSRTEYARHQVLHNTSEPRFSQSATLKCALCKPARAMCFNLLSIIKPAACLPSLLLIWFDGSINICMHSIGQHSAKVTKTLSALLPIDGYRRVATLTHNMGARVAHCLTLLAKLCLFSHTSTYMSVKNGK